MQITTTENKLISSADGEVILDSAMKANLVFEHSCKTGQCGVCKTTLLSGEVKEVQQQISLLEKDKANNQILTCCCSPVTDILIDAQDLSALHGIEVKTLPVKISDITFLTEDIVKIVLRFPPTAHVKFLAGQYVDISYKGIKRSYSISSSEQESGLSFIIKKVENGEMSEYWFNSAKEGDLLRIEGPKGTFFYRHEAKDKPTLMLATGTGIAPMLSILNTLDQQHEYVQNAPIHLYWGNRTLDEFSQEFTFSKLDVKVIKVLSKNSTQWSGQVGYVQDVALADLMDLNGYKVYACGSNVMIQSAKQLLTDNGLNSVDFHSDAFVQSFS